MSSRCCHGNQIGVLMMLRQCNFLPSFLFSAFCLAFRAKPREVLWEQVSSLTCKNMFGFSFTLLSWLFSNSERSGETLLVPRWLCFPTYVWAVYPTISSSAPELFPLGKGLALPDLLSVCIWGICRQRWRNKTWSCHQPSLVLIKYTTCYPLSSPFIFWIFILLSEASFPGLVTESLQGCKMKWK